ncbi:energy-coupling factor transporter transmembrane component T family protein [Methanoplanus endosymbiosus]|uniref:Energy-coupling factor transporter transmembrane protein EcfT n=1 Tax=Methanoplanus endosymbiosus TaxID=33865 RepID=A0A9E7PMB5_9EURY|nr:energy-coupling factor transporter transmembrane component T [Methanoplanus endosymbiosus]UUX91584.1 energy-coupling factor transporter transmembrane protein EcfT [Methanoplanus endosymbiosus]
MKKKAGVAYIPGDSVIHRLDPRTKLLIMISVSLTAFLVSGVFLMLPVFLTVLLLVFLSGNPAGWVSSMKLILPLLIFIVFIELLFCPEDPGRIIYSVNLGPLNAVLSEGSISYSLLLGLRVLSVTGISFLFVLTTKYSDFVKSLQLMKFPPIISFSLGYALRATTTLSADTRAIMDAQRSRGLEFDRNSLFKNRNKLLSLFIPMTVTVLNRSSQVSDAMQCRGYGGGSSVSIYNPPSFGRNDFIIAVIVVFTEIILINLSYYEVLR